MNPHEVLKAAKRKLAAVQRRRERLLAMKEWIAIMAGQRDEINAKRMMLANGMIQDGGRFESLLYHTEVDAALLTMDIGSAEKAFGRIK